MTSSPRRDLGDGLGTTLGLARNLKPVAIALLSIALILLGAGVAPLESLILAACVLAQALGGAVWWLLLRRGVVVNRIELAGMGVALGTLAAVLAAQLLRGTMFRPWGWALPFALTAVAVLAVPHVRRRVRAGAAMLESLQTRERRGAIVVLLAGLPALVQYWIEHPLRWDGWRRLHNDMPFHEALSHSVHLYGNGDLVLVADHPVRYHWLSHGWSGSMSELVDAAPYVVTTRLGPLVALLGAGALAWAWARRLASVWWVPVLAGVLVTSSGFVAVVSRFGGNHLLPLSPSQAFTTSWLLAFSLVLFEHLSGRLRAVGAHPLLVVLGFGLIGGKVSHAAVVAGGMVAMALVSLRWERALRHRVWLCCASSGSGVLMGYVVLIYGGDGNGFRFGSDYAAWSVFGLDPGRGTLLGFLVGAAAFLVSLATRWVGFLFLVEDSEQRWRPETVFGVGAAATGILLAVGTTQTGGSQVFFAISASAVVSVLAACGIGAAWCGMAVPLMRTRAVLVWTAGVAVVAAVFGGALFVALPKVFEEAKWVSPLVVVLLCVAAMAWISRREGHAAGRRSWLVLTAMALTFAAIAALQVSTGYVAVRGPLAAGPAVTNSMTTDDLDAGLWLRSHSDEPDIILTNRLCGRSSESVPECRSEWFNATATSQRRAYVEGAAFAAGAGSVDQAVLDERLIISARFASQPDVADHRLLWSLGVRWVWLDHLIPSAPSWDGFGEVTFTNDRVTIVRLEQPTGP